jgi:hypothetical protein
MAVPQTHGQLLIYRHQAIAAAFLIGTQSGHGQGVDGAETESSWRLPKAVSAELIHTVLVCASIKASAVISRPIRMVLLSKMDR